MQYQYDKVDRRAKQIRIAVERTGESIDLPIALPVRWWWTDLRFRQMTIDSRIYFDARPLTESEKRTHGLKPDRFASQVTRVDSFAEMMKSHELRVGDIVFAVDGVERDELAHTVELYIKLRTTAGKAVKLDLLRGGTKMQMELKTFQMSFRK